MKKYIFPILVGLSALSLAGAAAFFSVTGLSKLFGGAQMEVIIMASALEFAKLVTASFLHRYWKTLKWQIKTYLTIGVITVMLITSLGIYGFLSNAYSTTSGKLQNIDGQIQLIEQKKTIINSEITRLQESKNLKSDRVKSLVTLRGQQEARVDSLYNRRQNASAKRVEAQIEQSTKEISTANVELDTLNAQMQRKYGEISALDLEALNLKNSDVNGEVGPLKYVAKLTGKEMDSVVNFFILMLIFVFDPLAVSLVIATNIAIERELKKKVIPEEPKEELKEEIIKAPEVVSEVQEIPYEEVKSSEANDQVNHVENKTNEVISYVADENGEFKPATTVAEEPKEEVKTDEKLEQTILEEIKKQGIAHNANYLGFLGVLYKHGLAKAGDILPVYSKFLEELTEAGYKYKEKEVKDFLTICNLFTITDMSGPQRKLAKDYTVAKQIISLLSK
jgi:hypothetical protein